MFYRRRSLLTWLISLLVVFVILLVLITIFWHRKPSSKTVKPYVALARMRYHFWKDNAAGVKSSFKVEGEFHQQVEIDVENEAYEKLNVPPLVTAQRAMILHDFNEKLTAVISLQREHCFILPLNFTFVITPREFYQLVVNIEAGHDSADAELSNTDYSVMWPKIDDVSQLGRHIHHHCQYLDTFRLVRDDEPTASALSKKPSCQFQGMQYCLGNAGADLMEMVHIGQCLY